MPFSPASSAGSEQGRPHVFGGLPTWIALLAALGLSAACADGQSVPDGESEAAADADADGRVDADTGADADADVGADADVDTDIPPGDGPGPDGGDGDSVDEDGGPAPDDGGDIETDSGPPCGDSCDPFSIVLLPDTQYYTSKQTAGPDNTYFKQMQWILDNRVSHNIQFVIHLGDVTGSNTIAQWNIADEAHAMLDAADMPYSIMPGNHDYLVDGVFGRGDTHFNEYFGPSRFAGRPWYGGSYGSGSESNYTLFDVGPMRFMVISLEYGTRKEPLCWAEDLIAAHPDRRVIIVSHCILTHGGTYDGNCPNVDYLVPGGDGETIWDELASRHGNVFLVLCGHVGDSEYVPAPGNAGNTVHQILVDYQFEAACTAASASSCTANCQDGFYTGNGWMRELVFSPLENRISARTFSVEEGNTDVFPGGVPSFFCTPADTGGHHWYAADPHDAQHEFGFSQDLSPAATDVREDLGRRAFMDLTANSIGAGDQFHPELAGRGGGSFVAVWEDNSSSADGAGNFDLMVRGFEGGGCQAFSQRGVNTDTDGQQLAPAVGMAADGSFVVAWEDDTDGNGVYQIYARGFAADGSERFPRLTVNSDSTGQQRRPAVAVAPDGRFVVAWEDDRDSDDDMQVRVRGFTADGAERFSDRSVHADDIGQRQRPALAALADGGFVVAWEDDGDANGVYQIHARGFAADASERFPRLTVNTTAAGQQRNPAVGTDAAGGFVVVWEDDQESDGNYQVLARGFEPDGSQRFADITVNSDLGGQHRFPVPGVADSGAFVVVWQDDSDGNGTYQIRARVFTSGGAGHGSEWTVNHYADGQQQAPAVFLEGTGALVVAWQDDMDGNGAFQILAHGLDVSLP